MSLKNKKEKWIHRQMRDKSDEKKGIRKIFWGIDTSMLYGKCLSSCIERIGTIVEI